MPKSNISPGSDGYEVLNADWNSDAISVPTPHTTGVVQCVFTGDAVGMVKLQDSVDREHWRAMRMVTLDGYYADGYSVIGVPGHFMFEIETLTAPWLRVKYERTSGTGGLNYHTRAKRRTKAA